MNTQTDIIAEENQHEFERPGCMERLKKSKFFLPLFNYEYANDIRRLPISFRDPILKQKYETYENE